MVRVAQNVTLLSHLRLPHPERPGSRIYIPQEKGGALGSPNIASYNSQDYGGVIVTLPQPGVPGPRIYIYSSGTGWSSPKSKSCYDRRSVNQYILVPSPCGCIEVPSQRISNRHQEVNIKTKCLMLPMGGLHVKHAVQRGIWVRTQPLLCDQGK
jgi:hypothetical protein